MGNLLQNNEFEAVYLQASHSNLIEGNHAVDNEEGMAMEKSRNNLVAGNDILGNEKGIFLSNQASSVAVTTKGKGVTISYNATPSGAQIPSNNSIYLNNLSNDEANAYDDGLNRWDNGLIGNNYSDFNDPEEGCHGRRVCATPYPIPGGPSIDEHPQASPIWEHGLVSGRSGVFMQLPGFSFPPLGKMWLIYTTPEGIEAWVGLQPAPDEENLSWDIYLGENASGEISLTAPYETGSYQLVMHDASAAAIITLPFIVSTPRISASPSSVFTCEEITVSFQGARGGEKDWIGMYRADSSDAIYSQSLNRREKGEATFTAEEAGSYIFKLFATGESTPLGSSNQVEVKANSGHKLVAEPSQVGSGESVTVTYWGAAPASVIGMYGITSPDKFDSGKRSTEGKSCGSMVWQLPSKTGQYDFRMFGDDVRRPILAYSNVVTVA